MGADEETLKNLNSMIGSLKQPIANLNKDLKSDKCTSFDSSEERKKCKLEKIKKRIEQLKSDKMIYQDDIDYLQKKYYAVQCESDDLNANACYKEYLKKKYQEDAESDVKLSKANFESSLNELKNIINNNEVDSINNSYLLETSEDYKKQLDEYKTKVHTNVSNKYTNERRVSYYKEDLEKIQNINIYAMIIYYILYSMYILLIFILRGNYKFVKNWFFVIILGFLPFLINIITYPLSLLFVYLYKMFSSAIKTHDI